MSLFLGDENSYLSELEVKNPAVCSMFYLITSKASCHKLYPGQFSTQMSSAIVINTGQNGAQD
jgi:hypothetical protein